jgi:cytochrome c oxidase subunit 3
MSATTDSMHHSHDPGLKHQYEDMAQQNETYLVGMWSFLVSEVMFFGALFFIYTLYRWNYQQDFYIAHEHLDVKMGAFNTTVLLFSSFTMVMAVQAAQLKKRLNVMLFLGLTVLCACVFLCVKYFEYASKFADHLYPGVNFNTDAVKAFGEHAMENGHVAVNMNHAQLFYGLYFGMTGLHAVHIIVGIGILLSLMRLWYNKANTVIHDYIPTEMVGLYWHFVDLVWIFLFPLFYLMPKPH